MLPAALLRDLTFSTYEKSPLTCNARVIGTWWERSSVQDLPSSCYSGSAFGYNSFSGKRSDLPDEAPYADVALRLLAAAPSVAEQFLDKCEELGLDSAPQLQVFAILKSKDPSAGLAKLSAGDVKAALTPRCWPSASSPSRACSKRWSAG